MTQPEPIFPPGDQRFVNTLTVLVKVLEAKDPYTRFHSHSVTKWARLLGRKLRLSELELDRLGLAALFHDFGKIKILDAILFKQGKLNVAESEIMSRHPVIGAELLSGLDGFAVVTPAIRHHHERWDGNGYPDKLHGEQIPLWARIIHIAESFDTMMSRCTYKEPYDMERIKKELIAGRNKQFDPALVDLFLELICEHWPSHA